MTPIERTALVNYLEFNLINLVEKYEGKLSPEDAQELYCDTYAILADMERTLTTDIMIKQTVAAYKQNKTKKQLTKQTICSKVVFAIWQLECLSGHVL